MALAIIRSALLVFYFVFGGTTNDSVLHIAQRRIGAVSSFIFMAFAVLGRHKFVRKASLLFLGL